jgi:septal ring factor EnvC (AmiA/AmiB activator)
MNLYFIKMRIIKKHQNYIKIKIYTLLYIFVYSILYSRMNSKSANNSDHIKSVNDNMVSIEYNQNNPPTNNQTVTINSTQHIGIPFVVPQFSLISVDEYNRLTDISKQHNECVTKQNDYIATIQKNEKELKLLKEQNAIYVDRIEKLEKENDNLKKKLEALNNIINEQNKKISKLEKDNEKSQNILNSYMKKQYDEALLTSLQDLNRELELESKLKHKDELKNIREDRNKGSHYIDENRDSANLKMHKISMFIDHIKNINPDFKEEFECIHGCAGVLDEIV